MFLRKKVMRLRRTAVLTSVLGLAGLSLPAQQTPGAPSIPTLHVTAHVVVLDVSVNDGHGHAVKGLKPSDFIITEDGIPQTLASFTEHDGTVASTSSASMQELPPNTFAVESPVSGDGAVTVIVLSQLTDVDAPWVRKQLRAYLNANAPATPIAILRRDNQGIHLVQDFSADRQVLLQAVASKRMLNFASVPGTRSSLTLPKFLAAIPGRVNLIWFSSGSGAESRFPNTIKFIDDLEQTTEVLQLSRVALYTMDASGLSAQNVDPGLNAPIGPPTPTGPTFSHGGGLAVVKPDAPRIGDDPSVGDLAASTGGKGYHLHNGYKDAIAEVVDSGSHYYTISYSPKNTIWNGEYRHIHLSVRGSSPQPHPTENYFGFGFGDEGKVLYRRGYVAADTTAPRYPVRYPGPAAGGGVSALPVSAIPSSPTPGAAGAEPAAGAPQRRLLSVSRGSRFAPSPPKPTAMDNAMAFATPTPVQIHFTVTVTPAPGVDKITPSAQPPAANFLAGQFRGMPYRNVVLHYRIDPKDIDLLPDASGVYADNLQLVAVVYGDNGVKASALGSPGHIAVDPAHFDRVMAIPLAFDQTVAIPNAGAFFLRAGVYDVASGHIGVIEIPTDRITLSPNDSANPIVNSR